MSEGQPGDRLNDVLDAVLDLPPAERAAFLDDACRGDQGLRAAIDRLLASSSPADDFLERPALPPPVSADLDAPRFDAGALLAGRFRIVRLLGRGGMGEVYEATDGELGGPVAIKTIRGGSAADPEAIDRFRLEVWRARAVAHPNVCRVHELLTTASRRTRCASSPWSSCPARRPGRATGARRPPSPECGGRDHGAGRGRHRRSASARHRPPRSQAGKHHAGRRTGLGVLAKVTDFGLAGQLAEAAPLASRLASEVAGGTDDYMAPEQRANVAVGPAADLYAFGAVVHEMLTGEPPRDGGLAASLPPAWRARAARRPGPGSRPGGRPRRRRS